MPGYPSGSAGGSMGTGVSVNYNGAYGDVTIDPQTGQYVLDVNTTGAPVYGQTPKQAAFLSANIAGLPVMTIVIGLFVVAVAALVFRGRT